MMKQFFMTVDVEPDASKGSWNTSDPVTFSGVFDGVERLQAAAKDYGVIVTYLLQPVVLFSDECSQYFRSLDGCDIGSHLHGEYIGPAARYPGPDFSGCDPSEQQRDYSVETERGKMKSLTDLFRNQLGFAPQSFRAGRFGLGDFSLSILSDMGYLVDSSIVPRWKRFKKIHSTEPFRRDGVIEVPITVSDKCKWLRPTPSFSSKDDIRSIFTWLDQNNLSTACCMIHNVELVPGKSPYCHCKSDCNNMMDRIRFIFDMAQKYGYKSLGLTNAKLARD